jgi:hypothetical protein
MAEVPIPFVDEDVDTDEGVSGVAMTVGLVIAGFAVLAWARGVGGYLASEANSTISNYLGVDPTSGESSGADLV